MERALSGLRRHEQRAAVRASVLTLVAVTHSQAEADLVRGIIHDLGVRHPSRTLVVVLEKGDPGLPAGNGGTGVDAALWVHALEHDGRAVCFEEVRLLVRGPARFHLDSIVGPFALPDVPLVVWLPASLPAPGDPLLDVADRLVVDSRAADEGGADVLARAAVLARRLPVTDLSWIRLAPWRSLLAGLFEGSVNRPFLDGIDRVQVAGNAGPRQLLGGWLLRRLALTPARVELTPAAHVSVCIDATDNHGRRGSFCVARAGAERPDHGHGRDRGRAPPRTAPPDAAAVAGARPRRRPHQRRPRRALRGGPGRGPRAAGCGMTGAEPERGHLNGELIVVDDVASEFAERVVEAFHTRPGESFALTVSGGGTARRCYEKLAADGADQIDWWQVDVYWGDERCVPPDHPDSNERLVREALLERVGAANAVYPMRCDEGPDAYQQRVATAGRFDVVHLGLGPDGHTASLFPDSPAIDADPGRLVAMNTTPTAATPTRG